MLDVKEASQDRKEGQLNPPYGGKLVNLIASSDRIANMQSESKDWPSWDLTPRQLCDLGLLMSGGFSPLQGFMNRADYEGVCEKMRLADGTLWPMPDRKSTV